jgi:5-methylthioadenosine/S-adenosylhomocysteine deaminase
MAIIDFKKPHLCPLYHETSHLVYATKAADVEAVIINGKMVMENRKLATVNDERVMEAAKKAKYRLIDKLAANVK